MKTKFLAILCATFLLNCTTIYAETNHYEPTENTSIKQVSADTLSQTTTQQAYQYIKDIPDDQLRTIELTLTTQVHSNVFKWDYDLEPENLSAPNEIHDGVFYMSMDVIPYLTYSCPCNSYFDPYRLSFTFYDNDKYYVLQDGYNIVHIYNEDGSCHNKELKHLPYINHNTMYIPVKEFTSLLENREYDFTFDNQQKILTVNYKCVANRIISKPKDWYIKFLEQFDIN